MILGVEVLSGSRTPAREWVQPTVDGLESAREGDKNVYIFFFFCFLNFLQGKIIFCETEEGRLNTLIHTTDAFEVTHSDAWSINKEGEKRTGKTQSAPAVNGILGDWSGQIY